MIFARARVYLCDLEEQCPESASPRWARLTLLWLAGLLATLVIVAGALWIYLHPTIERTNGIVYGQRNGRPLTLDILRPEKPNGLGIALMVSGGWKSQRAGGLDALLVAPVLRAGYNVFAVCHISQPESTIMDIIDDVHRGIRFIRHRAAEYRVDPKRLGVTGGSAVQAVAIFYPPTDLLNLGPSTENDGKGGPPLTFAKGFGPDAQVPALWQKIGHDSSPIYYVTPAMPPVLIYHGKQGHPRACTGWYNLLATPIKLTSCRLHFCSATPILAATGFISPTRQHHQQPPPTANHVPPRGWPLYPAMRNPGTAPGNPPVQNAGRWSTRR